MARRRAKRLTPLLHSVDIAKPILRRIITWRKSSRRLPNERRGSTYAKYLDGQKWQLTQGVDFKSVLHYVRLYLYQL